VTHISPANGRSIQLQQFLQAQDAAHGGTGTKVEAKKRSEEEKRTTHSLQRLLGRLSNAQRTGLIWVFLSVDNTT